jgi:hypothetical protein
MKVICNLMIFSLILIKKYGKWKNRLEAQSYLAIKRFMIYFFATLKALTFFLTEFYLSFAFKENTWVNYFFSLLSIFKSLRNS